MGIDLYQIFLNKLREQEKKKKIKLRKDKLLKINEWQKYQKKNF